MSRDIPWLQEEIWEVEDIKDQTHHNRSHMGPNAGGSLNRSNFLMSSKLWISGERPVNIMYEINTNCVMQGDNLISQFTYHHEHIRTGHSWGQPEGGSRKHPYKHHRPVLSIWFCLRDWTNGERTKGKDTVSTSKIIEIWLLTFSFKGEIFRQMPTLVVPT